ncbi:MAG TPA: hypothetical protein VK034_15365 [Enhygromyxa sp.]|nr:hypothetical protein [Enhygromyxa sp.]
MSRRVIIIGLGLLALACKMDNPEFDLGRDTAVTDESGDGDPTTADESSESRSDNGDGDGDGDGDGEGDGDGDGETTDGGCTLASDCGTCQSCEQGQCVSDVGAPCDGPSTHCAEYLYGESGGLCYRLSAVTLDGRCSEQGLCEPSPASDCPYEQGEVHFACEEACVTNPAGCTKYTVASEVDASAMCAVEGQPGPGCTSACTGGNQPVVQLHGCVEGECSPLGAAQYCVGYLCNEQGVACFDACETDAQCAEQFHCFSSQCVPG